MFTVKRLVLLLLTGIIIATVACGSKQEGWAAHIAELKKPESEKPEIVKEVKPVPTSVTFPTLPPEYIPSNNPTLINPPTPIPPKPKDLSPEEFVEQYGIKRRSGPISSLDDIKKQGNTPTPINVTLKEIFELRAANKVAANAKYLGTLVRMEGTIALIEEDLVTITPVGTGEPDNIQCKVNRNQLEALIELRNGEPIVITGEIKAIEFFLVRWIEIKPCNF